MLTVSVWVKSVHAGAETVEMIGSPDQDLDDGVALIGAPGVDGLSDSSMGEFIMELQGIDDEEINAVAANLGLAGLCIMNKFNIDEAEGEEPRDPDLPFWQDVKRIKPVDEIAGAARRCVQLLQNRNPELLQLISAMRKGTFESDQTICDELVQEFDLLERHLTWIGRQRAGAVASMFANF